jgi:hypothetical protein
MKRNRHSPEQIIRKLREADADLAGGFAVPEICKKLGVAENTKLPLAEPVRRHVKPTRGSG